MEILNTRLYAAIDLKVNDLSDIKQEAEKIEALLTHTPYRESIPDVSTIRKHFALATLALKVHETESARLDKLTAVALQKYDSANNSTDRILAFKQSIARWKPCLWRGASGRKDARCVTVEGEHTQSSLDQSTRPEDHPPLFSEAKIREARTQDLRLRSLSRGDKGDRRWPGYPEKESKGRLAEESDGRRRFVPHRVVADGVASNKTAPPIKEIEIVYKFVSKGGRVFYDARIVFEGEENEPLYILRGLQGQGSCGDKEFYCMPDEHYEAASRDVLEKMYKIQEKRSFCLNG